MMEDYEKRITRINNGEILKRYDQSIISAEELQLAMQHELELIAVAMDKEGFYHNRLEELGGVAFSKENIQIGDIVDVKSSGECEVVGRGPKNITYKILTGGAAGYCLKAAYAEINSMVRPKVKDSE